MTSPRLDTYREETRADGLFVQRGSSIVTAYCVDGCGWQRSHGLLKESAALAGAEKHVRETRHQVSVGHEVALLSPGRVALELVR